ncbi:MAG: ribokinase [Dialister sp.]|nr:ribokinase [Dialister sp.]
MGCIAVVGSCNMDLIVESARRPKAGETVIGRRLILSAGGKGANQAVAAARLGAKVYMVGCIGKDPYGNMLLDAMKQSGVDTTHVHELDEEGTGTAHIVLSEGDNSIIVVKGANDRVDAAIVDEAWPDISSADIVLLQNEIPLDTIRYVIDRCFEEQLPVLYNPAPYVDMPKEWMNKVTYLTPNEHEAVLLFKGLEREEIVRLYPGKVIMTIGKDGVMYSDGHEAVTIPGFSVPVVDTTGAGDTMNGAFAAALSSGIDLPDAIRFANGAAALSIGKKGAQSGMPSKHEVEAFLSCRR